MKKHFLSTFCLLIAIIMMLALSASAAEYISYDLSGSFQSTDLQGIILTQVPASYKAELTNGIRTLEAGDVVTIEQLKDLTLLPMIDADTTADIEYIPIFSGSIGQPECISVGLFSKKNSPPEAEDMSLETYKNIAIEGTLKAQDPDGDPLTFEVTGSPKRGTLELGDDGAFTYSPEKNKVGKDSFTYTATDPFGNVSQQATVTIEILKPTSQLTYADMDGDPAHYAAIRLHEEGIFTGEQVGGQYCFRPNTEVTKGEFLAMALKAAGVENVSEALSSGFDDEEDTPVWVRPYITTALQNGIISGSVTASGSVVFNSEKALTKAEAAVIMSNALELSETEEVSMGIEVVPAWAVQAASSLHTAGIMDITSGSELSEPVTRADAAVFLSSMLDKATDEDEPSSGLLSWVFE